jgi:hypothetical protein
MRKPSPSAVGLMAFFACWITLSALWPTVCSDGWVSPSIGRPGACSWHGGVSILSRLSQLILIPLSLAVGFVASRIVAGFGKKSGPDAVVPQTFDVGAQVYHPRFGYGQITEIEADGNWTKATITFGAGPKKFHLETAVKHGLRVTANEGSFAPTSSGYKSPVMVTRYQGGKTCARRWFR